MKRKNYTLAEIMAVAAIIAILLGSVLGLTSYIKAKNAERTTQISMKLIEMALEKYKEKNGSYPASLELTPVASNAISGTLWECFNDVTLDGTNTSGIRGINTKRTGLNIILLDGWQRPFIYAYPGNFNRQAYDLGSIGPDAKWGDGVNVTFNEEKTAYISTELHPDFGKGDDQTNFKQAE